jgi:spermidine synthase
MHALQGFKAGGDGWFREVGEMWPGQGLSLKVKQVLLQERSHFQV